MNLKIKAKRSTDTQSLSPRRLLSIIVFYKWTTTGVISIDVPFEDIYQRIKVNETEIADEIAINFDDQHLELNTPIDPQILFQFEDVDLSRVNQFMSDNPQIIETFVVEDLGVNLYDFWKQRSKKLLRQKRKNEVWFRKHLFKSWKQALTLFEILIATSEEKAEEFYRTYHGTLAKEDEVVLSLANRLFARAIQISSEIHVLLSHGFADGAEARWRTLYETAVICTFIMEAGHKTAVRFIAHEAIDTYKAIQMHNDEHKKNGSEFISEEELDEIIRRKEEALDTFGKDFIHDYGWASSALPNKKGKITFADLQEATEHTYLRPLYKDASGSIHSSSRSNFDPLANPYNNHSLIISGPSVFGIGGVIKNSAFTLLILLENYISVSETTDVKIHVSAAYELYYELCNVCVTADRELDLMASAWTEESTNEQDSITFSVDELK